MRATRSLIFTPPFETESLDKLGTSTGVEPSQETTTSRSTQQSTLFHKLYSIITPTRTSRTISHAISKRSDNISADSQTIARPLPQEPALTVDPRSGPDERLIKFNKNVEKELDVKIGHTLFHGGAVDCVKFSRDGKYVAAGCKDGKTYIHDVKQGTLTK